MTSACVISCISILPFCGVLWLVFIPCSLDFVLFLVFSGCVSACFVNRVELCNEKKSYLECKH